MNGEVSDLTKKSNPVIVTVIPTPVDVQDDPDHKPIAVKVLEKSVAVVSIDECWEDADD